MEELDVAIDVRVACDMPIFWLFFAAYSRMSGCKACFTCRPEVHEMCILLCHSMVFFMFALVVRAISLFFTRLMSVCYLMF